jgi:hypothetical protein
LKGLLAVVLGATLVSGDRTIWWRTDGAAVIGLHATNECAMFLYNNVGGVIVTWGKDSQKLGIQDRRLHFTPPEMVPVAVQIGTTWIGDPNKPNLMAYGLGDYLILPLEPSWLHSGGAQNRWSHFVNHLLIRADHVTFKIDTEITYVTPGAKLPSLLVAAARCRKSIR